MKKSFLTAGMLVLAVFAVCFMSCATTGGLPDRKTAFKDYSVFYLASSITYFTIDGKSVGGWVSPNNTYPTYLPSGEHTLRARWNKEISRESREYPGYSVTTIKYIPGSDGVVFDFKPGHKYEISGRGSGQDYELLVIDLGESEQIKRGAAFHWISSPSMLLGTMYPTQGYGFQFDLNEGVEMLTSHLDIRFTAKVGAGIAAQGRMIEDSRGNKEFDTAVHFPLRAGGQAEWFIINDLSLAVGGGARSSIASSNWYGDDLLLPVVPYIDASLMYWHKRWGSDNYAAHIGVYVEYYPVLPSSDMWKVCAGLRWMDW